MNNPAIQRAIAQAIADDRRRYTTVMSLPEAKGREALASSLFETELSVEQIKAALVASPAADTDRDAAAAYERRRAGASVGMGSGPGEGQGKDRVARVMKNYRALAGGPINKPVR